MNFKIHMYHPSGTHVEGYVVAGELGDVDNAISKLLAEGYTSEPPTVGKDEWVETVAYVCRQDMERSNGEIFSSVLLFSTNPSHTRPFLRIYLDTDDQRADFEHASKVRFNDMPAYTGDGKPERGKQSSRKYILKVTPFKVVVQENPDYDKDKAAAMKAANQPYKTAKVVLVRYFSQRPETPAAKQEARQEQADAGRFATPDWWSRFLASDPPADVVSEKVKQASRVKGLLGKIKPLVDGWAKKSGHTWNATAGRFEKPQPKEVPATYQDPSDQYEQSEQYDDEPRPF